jgi:uncharacterized protein (TIGR03067 family)
MKALMLLLVPVALWAAATPPAQDPIQKGLEKLQGTWKLIGYEHEGSTGDLEPRLRFVVRRDTFAFTTSGGHDLAKGTMRLDPTTSPRKIDLKGRVWAKGTPREGTPTRLLGIYKLEGDTLWICGRVFGDPPDWPQVRPTAFKTERGDDLLLLGVFRRDRP